MPVSRRVVLIDAATLTVTGTGVSSAVDGTYSIVTNTDGIVYGLDFPDYGTEWKTATARALNDKCVTTANNNHWYQVETAGTTGTAEPTWPTSGGTVSDGTVVWRDKGVMERPWAEGPYFAPNP